MACSGCNEQKRAVAARVWFKGNVVADIDSAAAWAALPAQYPDHYVLAVKVFFAEAGTARNCSGCDRYWLVEAGDCWTIAHGNDAPEEIARKYPGATVLEGAWTVEQEMDAVERALVTATWP